METIPQKRILFYGTEHFGAAMLQALIEARAWRITGVVTQPDRPVGRRGELHESPVKQRAKLNDIPVFQPENLKGVEISGGEQPSHLPPSDLQVVCQYGIIMPKRIVDAPAFGTINVHTSLLPYYRGASPIQTAIMNGETQTGITIMLMDEKMDHGAVLAQEAITIEPGDTTPTLSERMIPVAQRLLTATLAQWFDKKISPREQNHATATFCRQFEKTDGLVDFSLSAKDIYNRFRALTPWPGTFAFWQGKTLKFLKIAPLKEAAPLGPGIIKIEGKKILLGTATAPLEIIELQREGGKPLAAQDFISGARNIDGARLIGKQKGGTDVPPA